MAVLARAGGPAHLDQVGGGVQHLAPAHYIENDTTENFAGHNERDPFSSSSVIPHRPDRRQPAVHPAPTLRPAAPPAPTVRVSGSTPPPARPVLAFSAPSELLAGLELSEGAARVYAVMHRLACDVAWLRGHRVAPDTVTMHSPALVIAGLAGYTTRHLRRLLPELLAAKLVAGGPHASKVGLRSLWDGCVWVVKVRAGGAQPVIQPAEWKHNWRPGFEADVVGKTGAAEFMSALQHLELSEAEKMMAAAHASVTAVYGAKPAAASSSADMGGGRVQDVVYRLGELPRVHARKRRELVDELGGLLAHAVDGGPKWKRLWCGVLWRSWNAFVEGRSGELQALGAALLRLEVDRREGARMRSAGAVLVARLKPA